MPTLAELIERDGVEAHWFWTHEVSTGSYTEYEVWDVVFVRNSHDPKLWVTDGSTRRTLHVKGIGGSQADSRRATGGERRAPDTARELTELLLDAASIDTHPTFKEWSTERYEGTDTPAWDQYGAYEDITRTRNRLKVWLGDSYDEYVKAAAEE